MVDTYYCAVIVNHCNQFLFILMLFHSGELIIDFYGARILALSFASACQSFQCNDCLPTVGLGFVSRQDRGHLFSLSPYLYRQ